VPEQRPEDKSMSLVVGAYPDDASADEGYASLEAEQRDGDFVVVGAVIVTRGADGEVHVREREAADLAGGATIGAVGGLVLGLFAPPLLLATAVGAGVGAAVGALVKRHKEKEMGADLEEYLPAGSSAVVAVVDEAYAARVGQALDKASKTVSTPIDMDDYETIKTALGEASDRVTGGDESD